MTSPHIGAVLAEESVEAGVLLLTELGRDDDTGLTELLNEAEQLVHVDPRAAQRACEIVRTRGVRDGDKAAHRGRANYVWARICAERGELDAALDLLAAARHDWTAHGDDLSALRTDLGRMQILDDLGRHRDALHVGEHLLVALEQLPSRAGDDPTRAMIRAAALGNIGVSHGFLGRHELSLDCYRASEEAYAALELWVPVAQQTANRGVELLALGRAREAVAALESARATFADAGDLLWAAKCAVHLAEGQQQLGLLVDALQVLDDAATRLQVLGAHAEWARAQLQMSSAYLAGGLYAEARVAAIDAVTMALNSDLIHDAAFARLALAKAHAGLGDLASAGSELTLAMALFEQTDDRQYLARLQVDRAQLAILANQPDEALSLLEGVVPDLEAGGWSAPLTWARLLQSDLAPSSEREALLRVAATAITELGQPELRIALEVRCAALRVTEGRMGEASTLLRSAIGIVETSGARLPDPMLRVAYRSSRFAAHDALVDLLGRRGGEGDLREALDVSDRSKAHTLHSGANRAPRATDLEMAYDGAEQLLTDLSATYSVLLDTPEGTRRDLVRQRAATLEAEISARRMRHAVRRPLVVGAGVDGRPVDLPDTGEFPPSLSFHVVGEDVWAFVVGGPRIRARLLEGALPEVRRLIDALDAQWSRFQLGDVFAARHAATLSRTTLAVLGGLYDVLLGPVRPLLDDFSTADLVVVPHRELHGVPFHALYDGMGHVSDLWTITFSATAPTAATQQRPPRHGGLTAFAVPDERAPRIRQEADWISRRFAEAVLVKDSNATSAALRDALPGPAYLHLACHGLYRPANPLFSALRLADRWFSGAEVLNLDLDGALVTLSACESGRSGGGSTEPVGLAWSFLAAGASGVVVSQWMVDDTITMRLMSVFYDHLLAGCGAARALQLAQREIASTHPHPYFWAPFVYVAQSHSPAETEGNPR